MVSYYTQKIYNPPETGKFIFWYCLQDSVIIIVFFQAQMKRGKITTILQMF